MYLRRLYLKNFRSCADVALRLQPTLTLLVGENNSGKSNVIDALRLATIPLSRRRTRYFEPTDVSYERTGPVELAAEFDELTRLQRGQCVTALDIETGRAWYTTRYHFDEANPRRSAVELLSGKVPTPDPEPEKRDQINHVYLAPLRDAQRELDSSAGYRLSLIMRYLVDEDDRSDFVEQATSQFRALEAHRSIQEIGRQLQEHVTDLTQPLRGQTIGIGFTDFSLHRLTSGLRLKMAEHGFSLTDIADSGLGYANLLFMATVILELRNARDSELTLFLVEEPEAHLHPQLQAVLLDYLREQAERSLRDDSDGPAGRIQVVATTHSPNLASAVGSENVVVLRTEEERFEVEGRGTAVARNTVAIPLCEIDLTADERRKIDQYLDVTRAELLFTRRAILVEGIAEAVVLPALAAKRVFPADDEGHRDKRRRFHAISVIAIGSVDFSPYLKLLLQAVNGARLVDRLVVITDGDPPIGGGSDDAPEGEGDESGQKTPFNRREHLEGIAAALGASDVLVVAEARYTLEADLMEPFATNGEVMAEAFRLQKPRSTAFWATVTASERPAETFYLKLRSTSGFIGKGEFAHDVARLIRAGKPFSCPPYLRTAIESVLDGPHRVG